MNKLYPLVQREIREHKTLIVYLPLLMVVVGVITIILGLIKLQDWGLETIYLPVPLVDPSAGIDGMAPVTGIEGVTSLPEGTKRVFYTQMLSALEVPFHVVLFGFMVYYFTQSLYHDRKDRSLLFWKSMPVSDRDTVFSKLITGVLVAPVTYLLCSMALQFLLLIIASVYALGFDVGIWRDLWQPSGLLLIWITNLAILLLAATWSLPFYSWIMLVSAKAKSIPFAWVVGIPTTLVLLEKVLFHKHLQSDSLLGYFFERHINISEMTFPLRRAYPMEWLSRISDQVLSLELIVALVVSGLFVSGAVYFRSKAGEL